MKIDGKKIVLTGASSGIGKALLEDLLDYDVEVVAVARSSIDVNKKYKHKVHTLRCDISKEKNIDELFTFALKKMGHIDIFIANAGFGYYEVLQKENWDHIENIYNTNVFSPIYSAEKMKRINNDQPYLFVAVGSIVGRFSVPGYALYSSTKAALDSFSKAYRYGLDKKARFAVVYPSVTKTHFFDSAGKGVPLAHHAQTAEDVAKSIINGIKRDKEAIYTSRIIHSYIIIDRIFPFLTSIIMKIQQKKLNSWLKKQRR